MPKQDPPPQFVPVPVPPMVLGKPKIEARQGRPVLARVGQRFAYQVPLSAMPNYPLTFTISEGPKGASISDSGLLTWEEPAGDDGAEIAVVVRITNRPQGVDLTDAFKIRVRNPAKP